jgi:uncharacterized membrane protein YeaQ/YmgE (transglycosylase-associated protein family)
MTIAAQGFIAMIAVGLAIGIIAGIKSSETPVKVSYLIAGVAGSVTGSLLFPHVIGGHISDLVIENIIHGTVGAIIFVLAVAVKRILV